jgi:hypothetical protein
MHNAYRIQYNKYLVLRYAKIQAFDRILSSNPEPAR